MCKDLKLTNKHKSLFSEVSLLIEESRNKAYRYINNELVLLYWNIGKLIAVELKRGQKRAEYGESVINDLSEDLTCKHGKGWSSRNLWRMVKFYELLPKVTTLSAELSWSHIQELLSMKDPLQRKFYLEMTKINKWSVRRLRKETGSMLFERVGLSRKPEKLMNQELKKLEKGEISQAVIFKDPYILDFLGLKEAYSEKDLEDSILVNLQNFLLELGDDFAFLEKQKRLIIDGHDYYLDLLFFHRKLNCLVVIDLKLGTFKAEYKGQMELYLKYLEKHEMKQGENSPVGVILCAYKEVEIIELLFDKYDNIKIAEFVTVCDKHVLKEKVLESIKMAKMMFKQNNG